MDVEGTLSMNIYKKRIMTPKEPSLNSMIKKRIGIRWEMDPLLEYYQLQFKLSNVERMGLLC